MMYPLSDSAIDSVQVVKPGILGDFVAGLAPYTFLGIERRLVRGEDTPDEAEYGFTQEGQPPVPCAS